jgi:hypothetical protein
LKRLDTSSYDQAASLAKQALNRLKPGPTKGREPVDVERSPLTSLWPRKPSDRLPPLVLLKETSPREWDRMLISISQGAVIPIISNSFRIEQIFDELAEEDGPTVVETLIAQWAQQINYPMPDTSNLPQVAQYYFVERNDDPGARTEILSFLKKFLWEMANAEVKDPALAARLQSRIESMRFSDLVEELDYPKFPDGTEDPLRLLARLPLPKYVTTSYYDFLERALIAEGKTPRTQICFWSDEMANIRKEHRTITGEFNESDVEPVVYHLYGLEEYPQTLVLSEDDYLTFLKRIASDTNTKEPIIPLALRQAFVESSPLLLGYRLSDWDFRVLFNMLSNFRRKGISRRGMVVHTAPVNHGSERTIQYLKRYFDEYQFGIEWASAESFIQQLWQEWDALRQG